MPGRISNAVTPGVSSGTAQPSTYLVQRGDSLSAIARKHGTTVQALVEANRNTYPSLQSNPGGIQIGWKLALPGSSGPAPSNEVRGGTSNDDILLVGMNEFGKDEAAKLRERGQKVTFIGDSFANDQVKGLDSRGRTKVFDLSRDQDLQAFALSLGLSGEQTRKVADVLRSAGPDARDELGQLAREFAKAEKGGTIASRLVLSGHNVGSGVWGDGNGKISWDVLGRLTEAMPRAARQIEDLHIAACYSGGQPAMERYRAMFPNVKTIWAYSGSAPGSWSGAMPHQARWEAATRGTREELDRAIAEGTRKGDNVAVWSARLGYLDGKPPATLSEVRTAFDRVASGYGDFFSGAETVPNPQSGGLRDYYNQLQRLLQHPDLPSTERGDLEARRDQTIRLLYYSTSVAPKFAQCYADQIKEGFEAVGLQVPDFSRLGRAEALEKIETFERTLSSRSRPPELAARLLPLLTEGLRDLDPSRIPDGWV